MLNGGSVGLMLDADNTLLDNALQAARAGAHDQEEP